MQSTLLLDISLCDTGIHIESEKNKQIYTRFMHCSHFFVPHQKIPVEVHREVLETTVRDCRDIRDFV